MADRFRPTGVRQISVAFGFALAIHAGLLGGLLRPEPDEPPPAAPLASLQTPVFVQLHRQPPSSPQAASLHAAPGPEGLASQLRGVVPDPERAPGVSDAAAGSRHVAVPRMMWSEDIATTRLGRDECRRDVVRSVDEQARCDAVLWAGSTSSGEIALSAENQANRRLNAEGARAFAGYDERRRALRPNSRAEACPSGGGVIERCDVRVEARIWSSNDGFLPGLRRPRAD